MAKLKNNNITKEVRARVSRGMIEPLEKLDLKEGEELSIIISPLPKAKDILKALKATAGGWKGLIDLETLKRNIYADRVISTRPEPSL